MWGIREMGGVVKKDGQGIWKMGGVVKAGWGIREMK